LASFISSLHFDVSLKYRSHALRGNAVGDASRHKNLNCSLLFRQSEGCQ